MRRKRRIKSGRTNRGRTIMRSRNGRNGKERNLRCVTRKGRRGGNEEEKIGKEKSRRDEGEKVEGT